MISKKQTFYQKDVVPRDNFEVLQQFRLGYEPVRMHECSPILCWHCISHSRCLVPSGLRASWFVQLAKNLTKMGECFWIPGLIITDESEPPSKITCVGNSLHEWFSCLESSNFSNAKVKDSITISTRKGHFLPSPAPSLSTRKFFVLETFETFDMVSYVLFDTFLVSRGRWTEAKNRSHGSNCRPLANGGSLLRIQQRNEHWNKSYGC